MKGGGGGAGMGGRTEREIIYHTPVNSQKSKRAKLGQANVTSWELNLSLPMLVAGIQPLCPSLSVLHDTHYQEVEIRNETQNTAKTQTHTLQDRMHPFQE